MRKVSKILFIIFIIMTVFSSGVSIILGVSSSTFLTFTNNATSRNKTLYTSYYKLITSDKITIKMTQPYGTEGDTSEDTMVCYLDKELAAPDYNCQMISYLYDSNNEVKRTSYFPGDNYKYTIEGTTKTKSSFPNKSLTSHFKNMVIATYTVLFTLSKDEKDVKAGSVIYDFNISFNFSQFTLSKEITYTNKTTNDKQTLIFNNKDYITNIIDKDKKVYLDIDYKTTKLEFPVLAGFSQI